MSDDVLQQILCEWKSLHFIPFNWMNP